jgi:hypothetical protein
MTRVWATPLRGWQETYTRHPHPRLTVYDMLVRLPARHVGQVTSTYPRHQFCRKCESYAAHEPFRKSVNATSTLRRSALLMAGQFFSHRISVFHEYKCLGLWKSLLAT